MQHRGATLPPPPSSLSIARCGFSTRRRIYRFYGPSIETALASLRSRAPLLDRPPSPPPPFLCRILSGCRALAPPGLSGIPREVFIIISTEVRLLISNWTSGSHRGYRKREGGGGRIGRASITNVVRRVRQGTFPPSFLLSGDLCIFT